MGMSFIGKNGAVKWRTLENITASDLFVGLQYIDSQCSNLNTLSPSNRVEVLSAYKDRIRSELDRRLHIAMTGSSENLLEKELNKRDNIVTDVN